MDYWVKFSLKKNQIPKDYIALTGDLYAVVAGGLVKPSIGKPLKLVFQLRGIK